MNVVIFIVGLAAITAGCALVSASLGLIVGGVLVAGSALLYERGSE